MIEKGNIENVNYWFTKLIPIYLMVLDASFFAQDFLFLVNKLNKSNIQQITRRAGSSMVILVAVG